MSRGKRKTTVTPQLPEPKVKPEDDQILVIKTASCLSSSGRSELTYKQGSDAEKQILIKIHSNTGNGYFNDEWLCIEELHKKLLPHKIAFGAWLIRTLYEGKSVNTLHFVFAALLAEGFLIKDEQNSRQYRLGDVEEFMERTQALIQVSESKDKSKAKTQIKISDIADVQSSETAIQSSHVADEESLLDVLLQAS